MRAPPACCVAGPRWIRERLKDRHALAALTGQDARALSAFLHLLELYAVSDAQGREGAIAAMGATLHAMQPKCWPIAKAAIPHVLDWSDEDPLWLRVTA